MIQSTNRLSRGARQRRPRPVWIYGVIVLAGVAVCVIVAVLLKP
jgi:hypothetical protein